jgi:hypothetical protein
LLAFFSDTIIQTINKKEIEKAKILLLSTIYVLKNSIVSPELVSIISMTIDGEIIVPKLSRQNTLIMNNIMRGI